MPFSATCLCDGVIGLTDGSKTYFYTILKDGIRSLGVSVDGIAERCSFSGRFLGVVIPGGVKVMDLERNVEYPFSNAVFVSVSSIGYAVGYFHKVEVWRNGILYRYETKGALQSLKMDSDGTVYACEDRYVEAFKGLTTTSTRLRCQYIAVLGDALLVIFGKTYKVLDKGTLSLKSEGELTCSPYFVASSNSKLVIVGSNKICVYELVDVRKDEIYVILITIAMIGIVVGLVRRLVKYSLPNVSF